MDIKLIGAGLFILLVSVGIGSNFINIGNPDSQNYFLQGDLVKHNSATDAVEAEKLYITDTTSCSSSAVGETNLPTDKVEISFDVERQEEGSNWISFCLKTNYDELKSHVNNLDELKKRANKSQSSLPDKITFIDAQGEHVFEIRDIELKKAVR